MIGFEAAPGEPIETIVTVWGAVKDGKRKEHGRTKDRPGAKGRVGTKAHRDAQANACEQADRAIRKKIEEGYAEVGLDGRALVGGTIEDPQLEADSPSIRFDGFLPKNLCFSKPKNSISEKALARLEKEDNIIFTRKVNGMLVVVQTLDNGSAQIYSRRMDLLTEHFPHLVKAVEDLNIPSKCILIFEAFMGDGNKKPDLLACQSIMRSLPERAVALQEDSGDWMKFYLIRIPVWKGGFLEQTNCHEEQLMLIENTFTDMLLEYEDPVAGRFLKPIEVYSGSVEDAMEVALQENYEGWVCYTRDGCMGEYSFSFHGKPDRPSSCFKLKPSYEDDFLAVFDPNETWSHDLPIEKRGTWGTGKNTGKVGTFSLYQYGPGNPDPIYICEVGSGLSDAQREELRKSSGPLVMEVKYDDRSYISMGHDTNALFLPRVARIREDKAPSECFNEHLVTCE
jgi:hypothetical protein